MDRGPMALFGAIVAVGLGPAMWLGAQFGQVTLPPERPPAVTSVKNNVDAPRGGSGAGDAPTDSEAIRTEPEANTQPLKTKKTRPATTTTTTPSASPSDEPSTPPTETTSPTTDPSQEHSTPPTESSTPPDDPPPTDDGPAQPPAPPTTLQADPDYSGSSVV